MSEPGVERPLRVSPREYLLVTERLLQLAGLDRGVVLPLREFYLDAELAGETALARLMADRDTLAAAAVWSPPVAERPGHAAIDLGGRPCALFASAVLDLAAELFQRDGRATVEAERADRAGMLRGLESSAARRGLAVKVRARRDSADVTVVGRIDGYNYRSLRLAGGPARLRAARHGIELPWSLWLAAYRTSNLALSPDTPLSRRHAGATVIDENGVLRGDVEDVIDVSVYSGALAPLFDESTPSADAPGRQAR